MIGAKEFTSNRKGSGAKRTPNPLLRNITLPLLLKNNEKEFKSLERPLESMLKFQPLRVPRIIKKEEIIVKRLPSINFSSGTKDSMRAITHHPEENELKMKYPKKDNAPKEKRYPREIKKEMEYNFGNNDVQFIEEEDFDPRNHHKETWKETDLGERIWDGLEDNQPPYELFDTIRRFLMQDEEEERVIACNRRFRKKVFDELKGYLNSSDKDDRLKTESKKIKLEISL